MIALNVGENRIIRLDKTPECDGVQTDGQTDRLARGIYSRLNSKLFRRL